jgi:hypothetical protein
VTVTDQIPQLLFTLALALLLGALILLALYWVIRTAVRDAIEDADRRRAGLSKGNDG